MFGLGLPEIVIILVVFGVFMFGSSKISDLARTLGRFSGEFKKGKVEIEEELRKVEEDVKGVRTAIELKKK